MSTEHSHALQSYLQENIELITQLQDALEQEKNALVSAKAEAIEEIAREKLTIIENICATDQKRNLIFQQAQLDENAEGMQQLISQAATSQERQRLQQTWQALKEKLQACERANLRNGMLSNACQHNINALINILIGENPEYNKSYTKQGTLDSSRGSGRQTSA